MKAEIRIENLSFTYPRYSADQPAETPLFADLSFSVEPGRFYTLIGAPESGKTTLSRILTALVPRYTGGNLTGRLQVAGHDLHTTHPQNLIEFVGTIFQNPDDQILTTRVDSEIAYPLESLGYSQGEIAARVDREMERFQLSDKADRNPATLSGGEKKRLLCAVLAAVEPPIWILDETLDEMDRHWRSVLVEHLQNTGTTVLLLSSKLTAPARAAEQQHIAILSQGRIHTDAADIDRLAEQDGLRWRPRGTTKRTAYTPQRAELTVKQLEFRYSNNSDFELAIDTLNLYAGETVTLAGPNGCGKTTLAKLLCGLYTAQKGTITRPHSDRESPQGTEPAKSLRSAAAYMFQNPDYQIFLPTIEEELAYGLKEQGWKQDQVQSALQQAIEKFQLPPADTSPTLMSYGTRKRLQAATYWLLQRPICIFDETDSGISPRDFAALIRAFQSPERALLIISHDAKLARHYSDRVIRMEAGRIVQGDDS